MNKKQVENYLLHQAMLIEDFIKSVNPDNSYFNITLINGSIYINNAYDEEDSNYPINVRYEQEGKHHEPSHK